MAGAVLRRTVRGGLLAASVAAAIGAAACGSDDPAYCADRSALEQSLSDLGDVDVRANGVGALESQLRQVESDARALIASARDEFEPEASALRSALTRLEGSARELVASPSAENASAVAAGVSGVTSAFEELSDAVGSRC